MRRPGALLAALLAVGGAASAQTSEPPYRRTHVPGQDLCLFFSIRQFVYSPDAAGCSQTPGDSAFTAMDAAFSTWQALSELCSDMMYVAGPRITGATVGYDKTDAANNHNVIIFREANCRTAVPPGDPCLSDGSCANAYRCWAYDDLAIALTTTTFSSRTGAIYDADIELNASPHLDGSSFFFTTVNSPPCPPEQPAPTCVSTDVQNTLTHEIGHAMGLDHVNVAGSTMEPTAPTGETHKRIIDSGTAEGFCDIYPAAQPAATCEASDELRKKVVAVNKGTALGCAQGGPGLLPAAALLLAALRPGRRRRGLARSPGLRRT